MMKNRKYPSRLKGFTLVELIVVMVILAILVSLMVPSLSKYIGKASERTVMVDAKAAYTASQAALSEVYAKYKGLKGTNENSYEAPDYDDEGNVKLDKNGNIVYRKIMCGKITNNTFNTAQKRAANANNNKIEIELATKILEYLDSFDPKAKNAKDYSKLAYDFSNSTTRLGNDNGTLSAEGFFNSNKKCDVALNVFFDKKTGKVIMIHYARRGCDKIAVVTSNGCEMVDKVTKVGDGKIVK